MFSKLQNINGVNHIFGNGNTLYYACLYPKFNWFNKKFSITQIVKPVKLKIINHTIFPSNIENDDRFFLLQYKFNDVVRKYILTVYLENDLKFSSSLYENKNKSLLISNDKHVVIDNISIERVNVSFYKRVMKTKLELDKGDVVIKEDMNFVYFKELYRYGKDTYPEELIKLQTIKDSQIIF